MFLYSARHKDIFPLLAYAVAEFYETFLDGLRQMVIFREGDATYFLQLRHMQTALENFTLAGETLGESQFRH